MLVVNLSVISMKTSQYKGFWKFFVKRKRLLRTARCRACKAYVDKDDSYSNER